jgi:hypothetical protein
MILFRARSNTYRLLFGPRIRDFCSSHMSGHGFICRLKDAAGSSTVGVTFQLPKKGPECDWYGLTDHHVAEYSRQIRDKSGWLAPTYGLVQRRVSCDATVGKGGIPPTLTAVVDKSQT